jgi:hypothetical protein
MLASGTQDRGLKISGFGRLGVCMLASGTQDRGFKISGFGGLGVCMLASGTQDRGLAHDRSRRIFPAGKIHSMQYDRIQTTQTTIDSEAQDTAN